MRGMVYKEFRTNWVLLLASAGMMLLMMTFPLLAVVFGDDALSADDFTGINGIFAAFGMFAGSLLSSAVFQGDEKKKWSNFAGSVPQGVRRQVYSKYLFVFLIHCALMVVGFLTESVMRSVLCAKDPGSSPVSSVNVMILMFFLMLFLQAIDLPFLIRFGTKNGGKIKTLAVSVISFAVLTYFLFGPLDNFGGMIEQLAVLMYGDAFGEGDTGAAASGTVQLIASLIPYVSIFAYWLSYRISRKLYLKGAENYDK